MDDLEERRLRHSPYPRDPTLSPIKKANDTDSDVYTHYIYIVLQQLHLTRERLKKPIISPLAGARGLCIMRCAVTGKKTNGYTGPHRRRPELL